jgi:mutator protein MutT
MKAIPTVGVLIIKDKKILLVRHGEGAHHETGVYGWPGGRIEKGESLIQAAIRELKEETGLNATEKDLEKITHTFAEVAIKRKSGEIQHFSVDLFYCKNFSGTLTSSDETIPEWVHIEDLKNYKLLPNVQKAAVMLYNLLYA